MNDDRMTLDDFVARSEADVLAFAASTRTAVAEGAEGFIGRQAKTREEWWMELAVYFEYSNIMEHSR